MNTINQKLRSVELCLSAHPHNEPDSEFADRISDLQEIQPQISELLKQRNDMREFLKGIISDLEEELSTTSVKDNFIKAKSFLESTEVNP